VMPSPGPQLHAAAASTPQKRQATVSNMQDVVDTSKWDKASKQCSASSYKQVAQLSKLAHACETFAGA
jgi:hypothetical protein